jgi:hypothetical protein
VFFREFDTALEYDKINVLYANQWGKKKFSIPFSIVKSMYCVIGIPYTLDYVRKHSNERSFHKTSPDL